MMSKKFGGYPKCICDVCNASIDRGACDNIFTNVTTNDWNKQEHDKMTTRQHFCKRCSRKLEAHIFQMKLEEAKTSSAQESE